MSRGAYRPEPYRKRLESVCFIYTRGPGDYSPRHSASRFKLSFPVSYRHRTPVRVTARTGRGDARRAAEKRPESGLGRIGARKRRPRGPWRRRSGPDAVRRETLSGLTQTHVNAHRGTRRTIAHAGGSGSRRRGRGVVRVEPAGSRNACRFPERASCNAARTANRNDDPVEPTARNK